MAIAIAFALQGTQMALVLLLAPLLTAFVRKLKARLQRRRGASIFQPYRDLRRLIGKEVVLADNASWLFRVSPYLIFAVTWVAAALVPTYATGLMFSWSADLIAIVALMGTGPNADRHTAPNKDQCACVITPRCRCESRRSRRCDPA